MNADVIRILLIADGLGVQHTSPTGPAWSVYVGFLPAELDKAIVVYDTAGKIDGRLMHSGEQIEHPGIQIRVRGPNYTETIHKAMSIARALDTVPPGREITLPLAQGGKTYILQNISRTGSILPMGIEEGDRLRHHFTVNAVLTIREKQ